MPKLKAINIVEDVVEIEPSDLRTKEFKQKLIKKFGDIYIFSKDSIKQKDAHDKITVYCRIHKEEMTKGANDLYKGRGCRTCGNIKKGEARKMPKEKFIELAKKIHGNRYNYSPLIDSEIENVGMKDKVPIFCSKHGEITPSAENHLAGRNCKYCSASRK